VQDYDAVAHFVARARGSDPAFEIDSSNAGSIAETTTHLDGLPLAIELAAARVKLPSPQDLLAPLDQSLTLLTSGSADAVSRHRTLRDAIGWSYDLLHPDEQRPLRRLGVLRGFTIESATAVTDPSQRPVFGGIDSHLSKSLIYQLVGIGEARFAMLETLREFSLDRLDTAGEQEEVDRRHATYFCHLAEKSEPDLTTETKHAAIQMLTPELSNIRRALRYALDGATHQENVPIASWILSFVAAFAVSVAPEEAVRLAGTVDSLREAAGGGMDLKQLDIEDARTVASRALSPEDLHRAWTEGQTMTLDQAVD
jgi:predicted ATPase